MNMPTPTVTCPECTRTFDLLNETDANEWYYGHDCEAPEAPVTFDRPPDVYNDGTGLQCRDCNCRLILFDLDEHFCEVTGTSTDLYTQAERDAYYDDADG